MKLQVFKAILEKGELLSLEAIHEHQNLTDLDCINKSEASWFRVAIDVNYCLNEEILKKQAQIAFDNYISVNNLSHTI